MRRIRTLPFTLLWMSALLAVLAIPAAAYIRAEVLDLESPHAAASTMITSAPEAAAPARSDPQVEPVALAAVESAALPQADPAENALFTTTSSAAIACPALVQQALEITEQGCEGTRRNEVCYGHNTLDAEPQPDVEQFVFDSEGDRVSVVKMQSLRLEAMNEATGAWGVALLRLQASLPDSAPDNVTVVLFGDVALSNDAADMPTLSVLNDTGYNINVRSTPNENSAIMAHLAPGSSTIANGRLEDGKWLRVAVPGSAESGWVLARFVTPSADLASLAVVAPGSTSFGPMQAFSFTSGLDDAPCTEAPQSGLMIQTPHGMGRITFLINEVDVQLGSTVFFQAMPGQRMAVYVVEGSARVTTGGVTHVAIPGTSLNVPLNAEGHPAGAPTKPQPYEFGAVQALPVTLLPREVTIPEPISEEAYAAFYETPAYEETVTTVPDAVTDPALPADSTAAQPAIPAIPAVPAVPGVSPAQPAHPAHPANPGQDGAPPPGQVDNPGQDDTPPPGQVDNPGQDDTLPPGLIDNPGLGDSLPPGHGGSPPGQDKKDDGKVPPGQEKKN